MAKKNVRLSRLLILTQTPPRAGLLSLQTCNCGLSVFVNLRSPPELGFSELVSTVMFRGDPTIMSLCSGMDPALVVEGSMGCANVTPV